LTMYYSTAIGGDVAIVTKGGPGRSEFLHPPLVVGQFVPNRLYYVVQVTITWCE
jgi:hypothetical protein